MVWGLEQRATSIAWLASPSGEYLAHAGVDLRTAFDQSLPFDMKAHKQKIWQTRDDEISSMLLGRTVEIATSVFGV